MKNHSGPTVLKNTLLRCLPVLLLAGCTAEVGDEPVAVTEEAYSREWQYYESDVPGIVLGTHYTSNPKFYMRFKPIGGGAFSSVDFTFDNSQNPNPVRVQYSSTTLDCSSTIHLSWGAAMLIIQPYQKYTRSLSCALIGVSKHFTWEAELYW